MLVKAGQDYQHYTCVQTYNEALELVWFSLASLKHLGALPLI